MVRISRGDHSVVGRRVFGHLLRHEISILAIILAGIVGVLGVLTKGLTLTPGNISNIWLQSASRGIATIGQAFVILTAGIDVSVGGLALLTAILGASLMSGQTGFPIVPIGIALLIGLGIGTLNGVLTSRIPMPALIVTLAMWQITRGFGFLICRGITIRFLPESVRVIGGGEIVGVPIPVIIFISIAVVSYFFLYYTKFGRAVYIVGGNPVSAALCGINVKNVTWSVYIISGFLAALAGLIIMSRVMSAGMSTVLGLELDSIAAVCIGGISLMGGRGNLIGAVIGVLIIGVINNGMNVFVLDPAYQGIVKGWVLITAVAIDYYRRRGKG